MSHSKQPDEAAAARRERAIIAVRARMARALPFVTAALQAVVINPEVWQRAAKAMAVSPALLADFAWEIGMACEEHGQDIYTMLVEQALNPENKESNDGGPRSGPDQAQGDHRAQGMGTGAGGSGLILPS